MPDSRSPEQISGAVHQARRHDSAHKHVSGEAAYIDDLREPVGLLHVCLGVGGEAHARVTALDLEPVRAAKGVVAVFAADDIPGINDISPTHRDDEPVFASDRILFAGQPLFAVAAETRDQARRAARLAVIETETLEPVLTLETAKAEGTLVTDPLTLSRGDVAAALGMRSVARKVGHALAALPADREDVPWHRVINARGTISFRGDTPRAVLQRSRLEDEGVTFDEKGRVDLKALRWGYVLEEP